MGIAHGKTPKMSFTIGSNTDPDVILAKKISEEFGFEHINLEYDTPNEDCLSDAFAFVARSDFSSNACSYAQLPRIFRKLDSYREHQVCGVGGEIGTGFYYTPLDGIINNQISKDLWIKYRLSVPGNLAGKIFKKTCLSKYSKNSEKNVLNVIGSIGDLSWRSKVDCLYSENRMRQWAGPVLKSSSYWYGIHAPFLEENYISWGMGLDSEDKKDRKAQLEKTKQFCPDLAVVPYGGDLSQNKNESSKNFFHKLSKVDKIIKRLFGKRREGDLGASDFSSKVFGMKEAQSIVIEFTSSHPTVLNADVINEMINNPRLYANELGFLLTVSLSSLYLDKMTRSFKDAQLEL
ncbi:MAG: hypothetical protein ACPGF7_06845 [Pontibacterium sp.]